MSNFKSLIWTIVGIVIFIAIVKFFIYLLPFVLIIALVGYIVFKGKSIFKSKKADKGAFSSSYKEDATSYQESTVDDSFDGKVIDVDYKEVDK